jgi:hypothetical protein
VFGYDDITNADVESMLIRITQTMRSFHLYWVRGKRYGYFEKWLAWQTINRPTPSKLPPPEEAESFEVSGTDTVVIMEDSVSNHGGLPRNRIEGNRIEGNIMPETSGSSLLEVEVQPVKRKREEYPPDFERVWKAYPRDENKKAAYTEWKKAKAAGILPEPDVLIADIERLKQTDEWNRGAIVYFERFIKYERWNDGKEKTPTAGGNGHDKEKQYQFQNLTCVETPTHRVWLESKDVEYFKFGNPKQQAEEIERIRRSDPRRVIAR